MSFWDTAWEGISKAGSWLGDSVSSASKWAEANPGTANILGNIALGVGTYFADKHKHKDLMRKQLELLNIEDRLKSKYSAVPEVDSSYNSLVVDRSKGLANGGILTEMREDLRRKPQGGV